LTGRDRIAIVSSLVCMVFVAAISATQQPSAAAIDRAAWRPVAPVFAAEVVSADRTTAAVWIDEIMAVLRRAPSLAAPTGFQVVPHVHVATDSIDRVADSRRPRFVTADILLNVAPVGRTGRNADVDERETALEIEILINDFGPLGRTRMGDQVHDWQDTEGSFVQDAAVSSETRHGYPLFEADNLRQWVIIRRNEVPFYAPVTRGRYLRLFIRYAEEDVAALQSRRAKILGNLPSMAAALEEQLTALERRAAAARAMYSTMSPADRTLPARLTGSGRDEPTFAPPEADEGTAVLFLNPALLDVQLPRAAPQVLAVEISSRTDRGRELAERLNDEIDWPALARIVQKT
jgi:hypothetical protein